MHHFIKKLSALFMAAIIFTATSAFASEQSPSPFPNLRFDSSNSNSTQLKNDEFSASISNLLGECLKSTPIVFNANEFITRLNDKQLAYCIEKLQAEQNRREQIKKEKLGGGRFSDGLYIVGEQIAAGLHILCAVDHAITVIINENTENKQIIQIETDELTNLSLENGDTIKISGTALFVCFPEER